MRFLTIPVLAFIFLKVLPSWILHSLVSLPFHVASVVLAPGSHNPLALLGIALVAAAIALFPRRNLRFALSNSVIVLPLAVFALATGA